MGDPSRPRCPRALLCLKFGKLFSGSWASIPQLQYLSYWPEKARFFEEKSFQSVFLWEIHEIHWNMMFVFVGGYGGYHSDLTSPESEKFSEIWCWAQQFLKIDKHSEYHQQKSWTSPIPPGIKKKIKRKNTLFSYSSMGFQALCDWDAIEVHGPNEAVEEMSIISIGNDPALLRCLRMKWCRIVPTACWL